MMIADDPSAFGRIWVDFGSMTSAGPEPADGTTKALIMTPMQLFRLQDLLDSAAIKALCLAVEHGTLCLNPQRIEIPGWSREWLIRHGMIENQARKAVTLLKKSDFIVKTYGTNGAAGGALAVVNGSRFTWPDAVTETLTASGRPRLTIASNPISEPSPIAVGVDAAQTTKRHPEPVDNFDRAIGRHAPNRDGSLGHLGDLHPDAESPNRLVSAIGQEDTDSEFTGGTREEGLKEGSLLTAETAKVGPLTRANLHRFLSEPQVRNALLDREAQAIAALANVFALNSTSTQSALAFFARPCGAAPEMDLAAWVYDLLTVDPGLGRDAAAELAARLRSQRARIPRMPPEEVIPGVVVTVALAQDKQPNDWPAYAVWAMSQEGWHKSRGLSALVQAINGIVFSPSPADHRNDPHTNDQQISDQHTSDASNLPVVSARSADTETSSSNTLRTPEPRTAQEPRSALPQRPASTSADPLSPSSKEMEARGDDYWTWLREHVVAGTEFDDDMSFSVVRRNRNMQDRLIERHRLRNGETDPAF